MLKRLSKWLIRESRALWAERRCAVCLEPFVPEAVFPEDSRSRILAQAFCPSCRPAFLPREAGYCPHCGEPSALAEAPVMPCGECLQVLPPWNEFLFYGIYEGRLRELMLRAKFSGCLASQAVLGELLAAHCAEYYAAAPLPDIIVPMPLHESRLLERGYNQCVELARPLEKLLRRPLNNEILRRVSSSSPQSRQSREARKKLEQPFAVAEDVSGMSLLLLDDVCTTGATLRRATEALLAAGASRVDVVVMGRTSRHTPPSVSGA